MSDQRIIRVGLLGCGIVGSGFARHLAAEAASISDAVGAQVEITRVAVRSVSKQRDVDLSPDIFCDDAESVVTDPNIDLVVEAIGGIEPARSLILRAFEASKPVVTANKELVATLGQELFEAADERSLDLYYEAAVAGGIPIIRPLKESLAGERITRVMGIVNGTTNYILTRMTEAGMSFAEALAEAEALGYAEEDPTADIEGFDAASKAAILASIAFRGRVVQGDVYREGISHVKATDIQNAARLGYVVKLLAIAELIDGKAAVRVHPSMVPASHPLAAVRESFNAVFVEGERVGNLMFYGRGAGSDPTGSAVIGDVIAAARHLVAPGRGIGCTCRETLEILPVDRMAAQYYMVFKVADEPGVLAQVAAVFAEHGVSIRSVFQEGASSEASLVIVTHRSVEGALQSTVADVSQLAEVHAVESVLRVAGEED